MPENLTWNKQLELRRVALDLTQQQAADLIDVPQGTYGRWERGSHKPMKIYQKAIGQAFEIDETEIFKD